MAPALTVAITAPDLADPLARQRLTALLADAGYLSDVHIVLLTTSTAPSIEGLPVDEVVELAIDATPAEVDRAALGAARGSSITFLTVEDALSPGYVATLAGHARPDRVVLAGPTTLGQDAPLPADVDAVTRPAGVAYPTWALAEASLDVPDDLPAALVGTVRALSLEASYRSQLLPLSPAGALAGAHVDPAANDTRDLDELGTAIIGLGLLERWDLDGPLARALRRRWLTNLRRLVRDEPSLEEKVVGRLHAAGSTIGAAQLERSGSLFLRRALATTPLQPLRVVVLVRNADVSIQWSSALKCLARNNAQITLVHETGQPSRTAAEACTVLQTDVGRDELRDAVAEADAVIAMDRASQKVAHELGAGDALRTGKEALWQFVLLHLTSLPKAQLKDPSGLTRAVELAGGSLEAWEKLTNDPVLWPSVALVLHRRREDDAAEAALAVGRYLAGEDAEAALGMEAAAAIVGVDDDTGRREDLVARLLDVADRDLEAGRSLPARWWLTLGVRLLFDSTLHASVVSTPLLDEPDRFLARLRSSPAFRALLDASSPTRSTATPTPGTAVVLEGAFPKFAGILVETAELDHEVSRADLASGDRRFATMQADALTLGQLTEGATLDTQVLDQVLRSELVIVDWIDKAAAQVSRLVAPGQRLILRAHGVDVVSLWCHLVDWTAVDAVIVPSEHLGAALRRVVGAPLADVPLHVVPNPLSTDLFSTDKQPGAEHTLGLVGWGQRVKDPVFALDVLSLLRRHDDRWRLRMIGRDFPVLPDRAEGVAARAFRERLTHADIAGAVDFVGQTDDVAAELSHIGWALTARACESPSTSGSSR